MARQRGKTVSPPYTVDDMADDAVGLLDALNIEKAHICGASMGGMIVQIIALRHPTRVLSLTSIMSTTGNPNLPQAKPEAMQLLLKPAPTDREAYIEESVNRRRFLYGSGFPFPEDQAREFAAILYDRSFYPQGIARQLFAILATENRAPKLGSIKVPTLVIHGGDDPLVPVEGIIILGATNFKEHRVPGLVPWSVLKNAQGSEETSSTMILNRLNSSGPN
ncbi:unnamed protein product, partial [marine sediment metagenome]